VLKSVQAIGAALLVFGSGALVFGSGAVAQDRARECVADIKRLCADADPGGGRVVACFKERLNDLSEPCRDLVAELATAAEACTADLKQQCGDAGTRVATLVCVKSALSKLSEGCKSAVSQVAAERR
jgi:hypothetical protein